MIRSSSAGVRTFPSNGSRRCLRACLELYVEGNKNQDILKRSNIWIIGVPEGEEEEQNIENLFEQIMKENFPHLAKEIDFQEVQEAQRVPKKLDPRRNTPRNIIITFPKIEEKENFFVKKLF